MREVGEGGPVPIQGDTDSEAGHVQHELPPSAPGVIPVCHHQTLDTASHWLHYFFYNILRRPLNAKIVKT